MSITPFLEPTVIQPALLLIQAGNVLEGIKQLFDGFMVGNAQAIHIFSCNMPLPVSKFPSISSNLIIDRNDDEMLFRLGLCYLTGIGITQSFSEAELIFSTLSKKRITNAQLMLAKMYCDAKGEVHLSQPERNAKAIALFSDAAQKGHDFATNALASFYEYQYTCFGLSQEMGKMKAVACYRQAAANGNLVAKINLALMIEEVDIELHLNEIERNHQAATLYEQSIQAGNGAAANNLAIMYEKDRAGVDLEGIKRQEKAISFYKLAIKAGYQNAAWNLADLYEKLEEKELAINFFSIAAHLYTPSTENRTSFRRKIEGFAPSPAQHYGLARIDAINQDDASVQLSALRVFKKPSEYAVFMDWDMIMLREAVEYYPALCRQIDLFIDSIKEQPAPSQEHFALAQIIIKLMNNQLQISELTASNLSEIVAEIKVLLELLFKHNLCLYLAFIDDAEVIQALTQLTSNLLAIILMEPLRNRELSLLFMRLIHNLPDNSALWQENNILRLCSSLMTNGQYSLLQTNKPLSGKQQKVVLGYLLEKGITDIDALDAEEACIDEVGLSMMNNYGLVFVDMEGLQKQAREILSLYSAASSAISCLQALHQSDTSRFNPVMQLLEQLVKTKKNHQVLIGLLKLKEALSNAALDNTSSLHEHIGQLLASAGLDTSSEQVSLACVSMKAMTLS